MYDSVDGQYDWHVDDKLIFYQHVQLLPTPLVYMIQILTLSKSKSYDDYTSC